MNNQQNEKENSNKNIQKIENITKENGMENRRKFLVEKLKELKQENKNLFHNSNEIQIGIVNNTAEIEILENYNKFVEDLNTGPSNLKRVEMIKSSKKKNTDSNEALFIAASDLQREVIKREKNLIRLKEENEQKKIEKEDLRINSLEIKDNIKVFKEEMDNLKNKLMLHYLLLLSEGKDTRNEGLVWIIKSIWNLGEKLIISYLPNYLDEKCIDFLFSIANKDYELIKMNEDLDYTKQRLKNSLVNIGLKNKQIQKKGIMTYDPSQKKLEFVNF